MSFDNYNYLAPLLVWRFAWNPNFLLRKSTPVRSQNTENTHTDRPADSNVFSSVTYPTVCSYSYTVRTTLDLSINFYNGREPKCVYVWVRRGKKYATIHIRSLVDMCSRLNFTRHLASLNVRHIGNPSWTHLLY